MLYERLACLPLLGIAGEEPQVASAGVLPVGAAGTRPDSAPATATTATTGTTPATTRVTTAAVAATAAADAAVGAAAATSAGGDNVSEAEVDELVAFCEASTAPSDLRTRRAVPMWVGPGRRGRM